MLKRIFKTGICVILSAIGLCLLAAAGLWIASTDQRTQPEFGDKLLFAHRGQAFKAPENSLQAIEAAVGDGYTAVEVDVRFTKDGKAVLFHDATLERMCRKQGSIEQMSLSEVQSAVLFFQNTETDFQIPTLEQAFSLYPDLYYYIDVKEPSLENLKRVSELIGAHKMERKAIVAHARFIPSLWQRISQPDILTCLEGFNTGKEYILKLIPQNLQTDYYASFLNKTDKKQMQKLEDLDREDCKIVYGVEHKDLQNAIANLGLCYLIADIEEPHNVLSLWQNANSNSKE